MTVDLSVLVLPAFDDLPGVPGEATPWYEAYNPTETIDIAGVDDPLRYTTDGLGVVPTGIGKTAAATTTTALLMSDRLDLSDTLIMTVGVAGGPPSLSIGSVVVGSAVLDWDDKCRFAGPDSDDVPLARNPYTEGEGVFRMSDETVQAATDAAAGVELDRVGSSPSGASLPSDIPDSPVVTTGTNVCGDELWHGEELAEQVEWLVSNADGAGQLEPYRATEMEDAGTARALSRFGAIERYVTIRGISNYDRPLNDENPRTNFFSDTFESGFTVGLTNAVRVARRLVDSQVT